MKKIFGWMLVSLLAAGAVSCSDDDEDPLQEGDGIASAAWQAENPADIKGEVLIFEFEAGGEWTAVSSESWCEVLTAEGVEGLSSLRLSVEKNIDTQPRSATVTVAVRGFVSPATLVVTQAEGVNEQGDGRYREVNHWMFDYMQSHYLWNEAVDNLIPDFSLDYQSFLTSMLDGIAAQDDINHDDGHWDGKKRTSYYSRIESNAPVSRSVGASHNDAGFMLLQAVTLGSGPVIPVGFAVMAVVPDTPAAKAGIKRGDLLTTVNGTAVTETNYQELSKICYAGNVKVTVNDVSWTDSGAAVLTSRGEVEIGSAYYTDPAIYKHSVLELNGKKVGYLLYMGFSMDFDEKLLAVFDEFRAAGVSDLILDLRYNPGGEVLSSVVLSTLIAGDSYKGQVCAHVTYNATRTAAGEGGVYTIGEATNVERPTDGYQMIADALQHAVGLKRVFVITSNMTASASEMVINGLRGLDIEVNLIGQTTNGKNVGMEGIGRTYHDYNFLFYPITFYVDNAKGFRDYSNGFTPDLEVDDSNRYPGEFGTENDVLSYGAILWIANDKKPTVTSSSAGTRSLPQPMKRLGEPVGMEKLESRLGGAIIYPEGE